LNFNSVVVWVQGQRSVGGAERYAKSERGRIKGL